MSPIEVTTEAEDRYHRLRLIPWWDQEVLRNARVLVVGAGALGNEILKNLGLLGVGWIAVVDLDRVETSNLSRSVLFRHGDEGRQKALVTAERLMDLNPDVHCLGMVADITTDIGLGVFRAMDVVIAGLDNREARLAINQACWRVNRPWIDGAIEVLMGVARVFVPPGGPCYECTMSELDFQLVAERKSCALLKRTDVGKIPTTPTTASVIAGVEVQEAVKILHGRETAANLRGKGFFFEGETHESFKVIYQARPGCLAHYTYPEVREIGRGVAQVTLAELLAMARVDLGSGATLEFEREIVTEFVCPQCARSQAVFRPLGALTSADAQCPDCGTIRVPQSTHRVAGEERYLDLTLAGFGLPPADIVTGQAGDNAVHYELHADLELVLPGWPARDTGGGIASARQDRAARG